MTHHANDVPIMVAALCGIAGIALGLLYFVALRRSVTAFASGGCWLLPAAFMIGRIASIAVALGLAARLGAIPLLAAFFGFLIARGIALRRAREAG